MSDVLVFVLAIVFRTLSGLQNGEGYAKKRVLMFANTFFLIAAGFICSYLLPGWPRALFIASMAFSAATMYALNERKYYKWVHSLETALTGTFIIALLLINFWPVVFAHFAGMTGHKIGVNVMAGRKWNDNSTDDPEGKFWTLYKFKRWSIPVPRLNFNIRLVLGVVGCVGFALWQVLK